MGQVSLLGVVGLQDRTSQRKHLRAADREASPLGRREDSPAAALGK